MKWWDRFEGGEAINERRLPMGSGRGGNRREHYSTDSPLACISFLTSIHKRIGIYGQSGLRILSLPRAEVVEFGSFPSSLVRIGIGANLLGGLNLPCEDPSRFFGDRCETSEVAPGQRIGIGS